MTPASHPPYGVRPDSFRLSEATRVGRVTLQVADLGRSAEYYERTLGLGVVSRSPEGAELAAAGGSGVLVELRARAGALSASRRGTLGLFHFALLLPDR